MLASFVRSHPPSAALACPHLPSPARLPSPVQARGQFALVYDVIWWIFWLSCAAALSNSLAEWGGWMGSSKGRLECSVAFSWLTW